MLLKFFKMFISNYISTTTNAQIYPSEPIYLTNSTSIVAFSNYENWAKSINEPISYIYYYINIQNPCPVLLTNSYTGTTTFTDVNVFISVYLPTITTSQYIEINMIQNGGLYPAGGFLPIPKNIGYVYSNGINNVYLTLESGNNLGYTPATLQTPEAGYGVALYF